MKIKIMALVLAGLFPVMANASNFAAYGSAGTNGFGLGAGTAINNNFGARLGFNTFKISTTQQDANGNYGIDLKLMTYQVWRTITHGRASSERQQVRCITVTRRQSPPNRQEREVMCSTG